MPKWVRFMFNALEHWTGYEINTWSILNTCRIYITSNALNHGYKPNPCQNTLIKSSILFLIYGFIPNLLYGDDEISVNLAWWPRLRKKTTYKIPLSFGTHKTAWSPAQTMHENISRSPFKIHHKKTGKQISLSLSPAKSNFFYFNSQTP